MMLSLCCDGLKLPSDGDFFWLLFSGGAPRPPTQSLNCWSSCNVRGKMVAGGMMGDSGVIMEDVCDA